jgi:hypothetical protein
MVTVNGILKSLFVCGYQRGGLHPSFPVEDDPFFPLSVPYLTAASGSSLHVRSRLGG